MSLRGYCRTFKNRRVPVNLETGSGRSALEPAMRMIKLTTIASTGRLMKKIGERFHFWNRPDFRLDLRFRCKLVVDRHAAVAQLENAGAHDCIARFFIPPSPQQKCTARLTVFERTAAVASVSPCRFFGSFFRFDYVEPNRRMARRNRRPGSPSAFPFAGKNNFTFANIPGRRCARGFLQRRLRGNFRVNAVRPSNSPAVNFNL